MQFKPTLLRASICAALASSTGLVHAGGFGLSEQSIAAIGMANAGAAAQVMDDASTVFYNPAGMSRLTSINVAQGLHLITLSAKFKNENSIGGVGQPPSTNSPGSVGEPTPIPTLFAAMPLNDRIVVGFGVSAPFGLKTEYNDGWIGRYQALVSDVRSYNFNPSMSYKLNDQLSLGFGVNFMKFQAELTNNVNYTAVALRGLAVQGVPAAQIGALTPALLGREGAARVTGSDTGYGFNLGGLYQVNKDTRFGIGYRSSIKQNLAGTVTFSKPSTAGLPASIAGTIGLIQNAGTPDGDVTVSVKTPASLSISGVTKVSPQLSLAGDVTRTQWSSIPELHIKRSNGATLTRVEYDWKDSTRVSVGASYDYGNGITARAGLAYDPSVVSDEHRTARLPDNNRTWLSFGGSYQVKPNMRIDAAFTHIFVQRSKIQDNQTASGAGLIHGFYDGNVNILSVGAVMTF
jgi:long-chain fatty acid transport protein